MAPRSTGSPLTQYWSRRDFTKTAEPRGEQVAPGKALSFVIQKHAASRLHYDFRLELDGVLVSWAVPKGPSLDPADKRLAVHVEDHPLSYGSFEGTIPRGQYGAGTVIVWDRGTWEPLGDPKVGLSKGKLAFNLHGQKLGGMWELIKIAKGGERQEPWLLFKKRDEFSRPRSRYDVVSELPDSVIAKPLKSGRTAGKVRSPASREGVMQGAVPATLPKTLSPQLATLAAALPAAGQWILELKFDGYRIMARIDRDSVRLITRGGHDWSDKMPQLVREIQQLGLNSAWLDGEIVVLGKDGAPDFNALQKAFDGRESKADIRYFVFDLPYFAGQDLREVPLDQRRKLLKSLLAKQPSEHVLLSADFEADPASVLSSACALNFEGIIAKRADAPYVSRRTDTWLKLKCKQRQEFVVCGYVERSDDRTQIGALLLGVYEKGQLQSVGRVGTGWDAAEARLLKSRLQKLAVDTAPFPAGHKAGRWSRRTAGYPQWVKPTLVAEVAFAQWTPDGQIRHAAYVALREDKPAKAIVRELPQQTRGPPMRRSSKTTASETVNVTHADRIIDASTGLRKIDLVRYYESVADWMLPHLQGRPCALLRAPTGVAGQQFFQKHGDLGIEELKQLDASLWPGHKSLLEIDSLKALASAAQMNVIEFHTWNSLSKKIERPDRMILDLDPGEGTPWNQVQEAATLTRAMLDELGLKSWLKTSGGKGLHVVVPLAPRLDYDTVKEFSKAVVLHLAKTIPSRFVARSGAANRVGKVFVDYLRNGTGATTAAAFSARARPGLGVSMPVAWDDLPNMTGAAQWTISNAPAHLAQQRRDPWAAYWKQSQTLTAAMKLLGLTARRMAV